MQTACLKVLKFESVCDSGRAGYLHCATLEITDLQLDQQKVKTMPEDWLKALHKGKMLQIYRTIKAANFYGCILQV